MQTLNEFSDGEWNPSPGTIYPLLSSLEEEKVIETVRVEGRSKTYRLTESGRKRIALRFHKKGQVGYKTRLGPRIWERLLDPAERIKFHMHGLNLGVEALAELSESVGKKDQERMLTGLRDINQQISEIISKLKSGGT
jgi:DNA-binding PadR family transcriptional regulator